jgi:5-methylcytosine-specific restriction protein A
VAQDPFYACAQWRSLRKQALERDGYLCQAPGCQRAATIVDHIVSRRCGGADALSNLRSLCVICDNRIKEDARGRRRRGGSLKGPIGVDGWPFE